MNSKTIAHKEPVIKDGKTFIQVYNSTPKDKCKAFKDEIAKVTHRSEPTVYAWLRGFTKPSILEAIAISQYLNRDVVELFPELAERLKVKEDNQ